MKLYGFSRILSFHCICYGRKGWFFKLAFHKKIGKFKFYHGHTTSNDVIHDLIYNNGKRFFGLMVKEENDIELFT